jgi:hypothetical protein
MTIETGLLLIAVGAVSMLVGTAMLSASRPRARSPQRPRPHLSIPRALMWTSIGCGVITGLQWAVLSRTESDMVWMTVLSLPAFLAAATVTRVLAVWRPFPNLRRARAIGRDRRYHP